MTNPYPNTAVDPNGWVFGTEVPRLVVSEAYAQVMNAPNDNFPATVLPLGGGAGFQAGGRSDPDIDPGIPALNADRAFQGVPGYAARRRRSFRVMPRSRIT